MTAAFAFYVPDAEAAHDFLSATIDDKTLEGMKPERKLILARIEASAAPQEFKAAFRARELGDAGRADFIRSQHPEFFTREALKRYTSVPLLGAPKDLCKQDYTEGFKAEVESFI